MLSTSLLRARAHRLLSSSLIALPLVAGALKAAESYKENAGSEGNGSFTIGPEYKIDPDLTDRGNPPGKSFEFSMALADSKIFKGDETTLAPQKKAVNKTRKIYVY